jgi:ketosteroid isomerase-like protein
MASDNKAIVRRLWNDAIVKGDMAAFDDVVSPDFVDLARQTGDDVRVFRAAIATAITTLTDQRFEELDMVADGDTVFARVNYTATMPDGSSKTDRGLLFYRLKEGKIIENLMAAPA